MAGTKVEPAASHRYASRRRSESERCSKTATAAKLRKHLAAFKIPEHIWLREEQLPRIASGKIFKRQLKADYAAQLSS